MPMEDEEEQKNILDYAVDFSPDMALLYGLTRAQQDGVIKDIADEIVRERDAYEGFPDLGDIDERNHYMVKSANDRASIMNAIQNLPDEMQDSFLLGYNDAGKPIFNRNLKNSVYKNIHNKVYLKDLDINTLIHEYMHSAHSNMSRFAQDPYRRRLLTSEGEFFPDFMVKRGIGKSLYDEYVGDLRNKVYQLIANGEWDAVREAIEDHVGYLGNRDLEKLLSNISSDLITLNPNDTIPDGKMVGHKNQYKEDAFDIYKYIYPNEKNDVIQFSPSSVEGSAEMASVLANDGGREWMLRNAPSTYLKMMKAYEEDPRKALLKIGSYNIPKMWKRKRTGKDYNNSFKKEKLESLRKNARKALQLIRKIF